MPEMMICQTAKLEREKEFTDLYMQIFPLVAQYISRMGGSLEDAKDVFQDALVVYYEKVMTSADFVEKDEKSYILGIARHLWYRKYQDKRNHLLTEDFADKAEEMNPEPSAEKLMRFLEVAGRKCLDLLKSFYYDRRPMQEVAETFDYATVRSATVQKYKCLEKVRDQIKEKSMTYEDFLA